MKYVKRALLPLLAFAVLVISTAANYPYETFEGDPIQARIYTLDNGLKVYMAVNHEVPRIQTYIAVRVGGKNDPSETTGLAHYFEHLMFKGTESFGTKDYAAEKVLLDQIEEQFEIYRKVTDEQQRNAIYKVIDSLSYEASKYAIPNEYDKLMSAIGAQGTNAYTSYDQTVYIEDIPSNQIENWAKIQADRFKNNVIRGFHTELETVYEEKNMSLTKDSRKVLEAMLSALFQNHPYGTQTVLGTQEHLKNPSITNIKNYFKTYYVPNNMAICLSGDFDPDEMIAVIDKYFGDMVPNNELPEFVVADEVPITSPIVKTVLGLDAENVTLAWRAPGISNPESDILELIASVLFNGKAGLIDLDLIQKQRILTGYGYYMSMSDHGMMIFQGYPKAGQSLEEVRDLILGEIAKLKAGDFDESLLEATINNYKAHLAKQRDTNQGRAQLFEMVYTNGLDYSYAVHLLDRMNKVTKQDIIDLANKVMGEDNYAIIYKRQGQDPQEMKISKPDITPIVMNRDDVSGFLASIQRTPVEPIEPVFLDYDTDLGKTNVKGVEVLFTKNPTNDLFNLTYVYETGSNNDPAMNFAFNYLDYLGTSKYTPEQIQQEFYRIACDFSVSSAAERSFIVISGLNENMERAMELFEELLADAQPNEMALMHMKADLLKRRADAKLNQNVNFNMLRTYATYGPKSPATNALSTEQLEALTSEEVLSKIYALRSMEHRILYYGPKDESELVSALTAHHYIPQQLNPAPEMVKFPYLETNENKVLVAHYDAKQILYSQYSNRGEKYNPAMDPITSMYNEYFGGGMNAIVFQEMREARALAYSANAYLMTPGRLDIPYTMTAFIATQNDKMGEAIEAFEDIINNMPESEAAFQIAKWSLISNYRTQRVIKENILWNYIAAQDRGLNYDRRKNIYEGVQSLTLEDVKKFQQEWIKGRKYTFSVLGDLEDIDMDKLSEYGPIQRLTQEELFGY